MKTVIKYALISIIILVIIGLWYQNKYSMSIAKSAEYGNIEAPTTLLIATQGSPYKDQITSNIVAGLVEQDVLIKTLDISQLPIVKASNYEAIVIVHSWEVWKAPIPVTEFIEQNKTSNIFVIGTSGDGDLAISGVDGITSASYIPNVETDANQALNWIKNKINIQ